MIKPVLSAFTIPLFGSGYMRGLRRKGDVRKRQRQIRQQALAKRLKTMPTIMDIADGATMIAERSIFDLLAHRENLPGTPGIREVLFVMTGVDGKQPLLHFINANKYQYHFDFVNDFLKLDMTREAFIRATYFSKNRKFLAGSILAHDNYASSDDKKGIYTVEFWPTDPVPARLIRLAASHIEVTMPFAKGKLFYHLLGYVQESWIGLEDLLLGDNFPPIIFSDKLLAGQTYSPLNPGVSFGKLRIVDGANPQPLTAATIAVFKTVPNDLPHVAGVLSEILQTPLSHVNLRARQNQTPNAYLKNASRDPRILKYQDQIVRFEVLPDDISIRLATRQEMIQFLEKVRPKNVQFPSRDLSETNIRRLGEFGHNDLKKIGAKAANVAELRKILDKKLVPDGFAVPFYFYHRFMSENGLYTLIRERINTPQFRENAGFRKKALKKIRKKIKQATMPHDLHHELGIMAAKFPVGVTPRCRSSSNNEDLTDFSGAGLYSSHTHRFHEGHISHTIKQVWASLWNFRAFEARDFYRVDHFRSAMAVLVHPNFDDERANGVAVTKNIYYPGFGGFYINVQVGENLVTNPRGNAVSEELVILEEVNEAYYARLETIRIRYSNLVKRRKPVLEKVYIDQLTKALGIIHEHFLSVYKPKNRKDFAMDIEFKVDKSGQLLIKQARPWLE